MGRRVSSSSVFIDLYIGQTMSPYPFPEKTPPEKQHGADTDNSIIHLSPVGGPPTMSPALDIFNGLGHGHGHAKLADSAIIVLGSSIRLNRIAILLLTGPPGFSRPTLKEVGSNHRPLPIMLMPQLTNSYFAFLNSNCLMCSYENGIKLPLQPSHCLC